MCETEKGCHLEDLYRSSDYTQLESKVVAFLQAEAMAAGNGSSLIQEKIIKESGLLDESPGTLVDMRNTFVKYQNWRRKNEMTKAKARKAR